MNKFIDVLLEENSVAAIAAITIRQRVKDVLLITHQEFIRGNSINQIVSDLIEAYPLSEYEFSIRSHTTREG